MKPSKEETVQAATNDDCTLDEFCAALSLERVSTELIAGFHLTERRAGHIKSGEADFRNRFSAYRTRKID